MKKMKTVSDIPGIVSHIDKKHFYIRRKNLKRAEALIERKWLFFYHVIICDGFTIFEGTVSYPRLVFIIDQVIKEKLVA